MASLDENEGLLSATLNGTTAIFYSANALSGTIPEIFAALSSLRYFDVGEFKDNPTSSNNISGTLPAFEFANLSHRVCFSTNPISGVMPNVMQQGSVADF